ncbi:hypothetical protein G4B88_021034 [Cannabis sativa]|uniref:carnosine N-methyltransferase n=1 Tax=Cannabis sativa TaxID=3483 RepID=A0A7J6HZI6_CANSA|nr:hypothetical protein G4B88_021034 [Cannabis sativa]
MSSLEGHTEDEEQIRQRKLEEALEIKSLRRIVSAYLNHCNGDSSGLKIVLCPLTPRGGLVVVRSVGKCCYPEAADEDVRRYERSFKKLPPPQQALLSHYPLKFQELRRCISANSYFIFTMLQAFEPPLDMSQDIDDCENPPHEDDPNNQGFCEKRDVCCSHSTSTSGRTCFSQSSKACCEEGNNLCNSQEGDIGIKEVQNEGCSGSCTVRTPGLECDKELKNCCGNDAMDSNGNASLSNQEWLDPSLQFDVPLVDVDKVRCIIRNIVRDWAEEGQKERDQCYKPVLEELDILFPNRSKESPPACLVPGAGLGRLALEISRLGFISQGNEFSYYMMICSSFILNKYESDYTQIYMIFKLWCIFLHFIDENVLLGVCSTEDAGEWKIYPWIHSNCNSLSDSDQLRPVSIPDIHPASAGLTEGFSMCGGDFVEVYNDPSQVGIWDVVVTCFFIDTAHNIVEYIEIISKILKDGGIWINLGPLLYHFADMYGQEDEMSIELSLEDVKKVALHYGFNFEKEKTIETTYTTNSRSMMQNRYFAAFWTARKKSAMAEEHAPE